MTVFATRSMRTTLKSDGNTSDNFSRGAGIVLGKKPVKATAGVDDVWEVIGMKIDDEKIEDAVLALLWLTCDRRAVLERLR